MPTLTAIRRYPVKSCRGDDVAEAVVEPWGLAGDRRWMVVDDEGGAITARECNRMLLIHPTPVEGGLRVTAPGLPALSVAVPTGEHRSVEIWDDRVGATPAGAEADAWFGEAMGRPAHLVYLDDPTARPVDPRFAEPDDRVSFADGYPLLLASESSLAALNDEILARSQGAHGALPMVRFRPSIVVAGAPAWAEDDWRVVRVGEAVFRAVKGCARCVMTTVDPETAERGKEPIASLARIRRWDGQTWFAVNLVPANPGAVVRLGDEVEVLEAAPPGGGPLRPSQL